MRNWVDCFVKCLKANVIVDIFECSCSYIFRSPFSLFVQFLGACFSIETHFVKMSTVVLHWVMNVWLAWKQYLYISSLLSHQCKAMSYWLARAQTLSLKFPFAHQNVITVGLCMGIIFIELFMIMSFSVTSNLFQAHSSIRQFRV